MGAWGSGILQDDTALDFLDELRGTDRPFERMRLALEDALGAGYLEYDAGQAALVSAGVVDTALGGEGIVDDDEEVRGWLTSLGASEAAPLRPLAARALRRLLAPGSELRRDRRQEGPAYTFAEEWPDAFVVRSPDRAWTAPKICR